MEVLKKLFKKFNALQHLCLPLHLVTHPMIKQQFGCVAKNLSKLYVTTVTKTPMNKRQAIIGCLGLFLVMLLSGCRAVILNDYTFERQYKNASPDNVWVGGVFIQGTKYVERKSEKTDIVTYKEPYSVMLGESCRVRASTHEEFGHPKAIVPHSASVYILKKNQDKIDMELINPNIKVFVQKDKKSFGFNVRFEDYLETASDYESYGRVSIGLEYLDYGSFIEDNLIHAETEEVGCQVSFTVIYMNEIEEIYNGAKVLFPVFNTEERNALQHLAVQ